MQQAHLIIHRGTANADRWRSYKLFANNALLGKVKRNDQLEVALSPGSYDIEARIDWTTSEVLWLELAAGETQHIEVSNTYGALKAGWAITAGMDSYLSLRELDGPPTAGG